MITNLIQTLIDGGMAVLNLLPTSPFYTLNEIILTNEVLSYLAWFVPLGPIVGLLQLWVTAIVGWYAIKKILRWAKIIV
jgi:hypothetical protein